MKTRLAEELIQRYLQDTCTPEERLLIELWFESLESNDLNFDGSQEEMIAAKMKAQIDLQTSLLKSRGNLIWLRVAGIAATVSAIVFGIWFFSMSGHPDASLANLVKHTNDIRPGSNKATVTFANGKTINLSDAKNGLVMGKDKLSYNDGTAIAVSPDFPHHDVVVSTPRGGMYQVTLSDGTKVWLNAASSLTYNTSLIENGIRRVNLEGEAYFEVSKDKNHPFIVSSKNQKVTVLGTHFNINSYADEAVVKTTLLEGSVKVNDMMLKPNQQSLLTGNKIIIQQADVENDMAWKNGEFIFKEDDLRATMRKIARWYDVEIIYDASAPAVLAPGGWVSRSKNIAAVLKIMEATGKVHFKLEGRRITVMR